MTDLSRLSPDMQDAVFSQMITRRSFIRRSSAAALAAAGLSALPGSLMAASDLDRPRKPTLIVVYLRGGADPLNTLVPFSDPLYATLRPTVAVGPPRDGDPNAALPLTNQFGLHPAMKPLLPYFLAGKVAPILNVGSPHHSRSHFDAQDFMERAAPGIRTITDGWLNRYLQATKQPNDPELRAISLQPLLPRSLRGEYPVLAAPGHGSEQAMAAFEDLYESGAMSLPLPGQHAEAQMGAGDMEGEMSRREAEIARRRAEVAARKLRLSGKALPEITGEDARRSIVSAGDNTIRRLREYQSIVAARDGSRAAYPDRSWFGGRLHDVAKLIKSNRGLEMAALDYGGWDHHAYMGGPEGQMARMLGDVSASLAAFMADLGDLMDQTLILVMSEFGRTVAENGNNGTDHGRGGMMLAMGNMVNGNRMYGKWTGLESKQLADGRDLPVHTDFRLVFAEALFRLFKFDAITTDDFFPGYRQRNKPLNFMNQVG